MNLVKIFIKKMMNDNKKIVRGQIYDKYTMMFIKYNFDDSLYENINFIFDTLFDNSQVK